MKVAVFGLWHLGSVTAACLGQAGHTVTGIEPDKDKVAGFRQGKAPLFEPGLDELLKKGIDGGRLSFTSSLEEGLKEAQVLWVTFDTPVDDKDRADTEFVSKKIQECFPYLSSGMTVLISSQMPVGSTGKLQDLFNAQYTDRKVRFCYSPENLRLGKAIEVFTRPDRVVVGAPDTESRKAIQQLLSPVTDRIEWMSVASAEMTKHAINTFLATSVVFINELATLCEKTGADAKEVERGLKTEQRIGPKAYVSAGGAFAGGTLARDVVFLKELSEQQGRSNSLFGAVLQSNESHKLWSRNKLAGVMGTLQGKSVGVLGLAYKTGTSTLRRSSAVELCRWLKEQGAKVSAFDPVIKSLPAELSPVIQLSPGVEKLFLDNDAVVVANEWPELKALSLKDLLGKDKRSVIIDPNGFFAGQPLPQGVKYCRVGASEQHLKDQKG